MYRTPDAKKGEAMISPVVDLEMYQCQTTDASNINAHEIETTNDSVEAEKKIGVWEVFELLTDLLVLFLIKE